MEQVLKKNALVSKIALFTLITTLYLLTMPIQSGNNFDAVGIAHFAANDVDFTIPNHLILISSYRVILQVADAIGVTVRPFILLQTVNSFAGSLSVLLFFLFLINVGFQRRHALLITLALAFSYVHWLFSREVETAIVSQLFLLATLWLQSKLFFPSSQSRTWMIVVLSALTTALSILYALNSIVFFPSICLFLYFVPIENSRYKRILVYSLLGGTVTFLVYSIVYAFINNAYSVSGLFRWVSYHPSMEYGSPELAHVNFTNLFRSLSGLVNAFLGNTAVTTSIKLIMRGQHTFEIAAIEYVKFAVGVMIAGYLLLAFFFIPSRGKYRQLYIVCTTAFVLNTGFCVLWLGSDPQFWLSTILFVFVVAGMAYILTEKQSRLKKALFYPLPVAIAVMFFVNVFYPVPTILMPNGGSDWQKAKMYTSLTTPNDLLVYTCDWGKHLTFENRQKLNLPYSITKRNEEFTAMLVEGIEQTLRTGAKVYAAEIFSVNESYSNNNWEQVENYSHLSRDRIVQSILDRFEASVVFPDKFGNSLWEIKAKPMTSQSE